MEKVSDVREIMIKFTKNDLTASLCATVREAFPETEEMVFGECEYTISGGEVVGGFVRFVIREEMGVGDGVNS